MQKLRDPNTFKGAIAKIIDRLGRDYCGEITGLRERQLYNYSDPDSDQLPNLAKAIALDMAFTQLAGEPGPILQAYQHKVAGVKAPRHEPECPNKRTADVVRELGEAVTYELGLPEVGPISQNQHMRACKEWDDLEALCRAKKRDLDARLQPSLREVKS